MSCKMNAAIRILSKSSSQMVKNKIKMLFPDDSIDLIDQSPIQKEEIYNKHLPYADKINDEAKRALSAIKSNFGRCVMTRDINPGCVYWCQNLSGYIDLYGRCFTKEEHITFIKLTYELIIIPNLQPTLVELFSEFLIKLLKKKELITPKELELHWRPLYNLCQTFMYRNSNSSNLYRYPMAYGNTLEALVKIARNYFPPTATREILDELEPRIFVPNQTITTKTFKLLQWFLPVQLAVEYHHIGHQLWFDEFMNMWQVCHNVCDFDNDMMHLMAKLASNNIGYIDWNPHIPIMFNRIIRSFALPITYKNCPSTSYIHLQLILIGEWIASVLGDHTNAQMYLEKFLKTVETYFHPANDCVGNLDMLFHMIIHSVVLRIHKERHAKDTWELPVPENYKLTDSNIDAFVNSMLPVALTAIFNDCCLQFLCFALADLAKMRPNIVIPALLEKFCPNLGEDIQPQKFKIAISCILPTIRPLCQGSRYPLSDYSFPEGPTQILPLLFSSLPGIDPNDPDKCFTTFSLIGAIGNCIPCVDCSKTNVNKTDLDHQVCQDTARFEDFVLQLLDKIFILINLSSLEFVRMENNSTGGKKSILESMAEHILYQEMEPLLMSMSTSIFKKTLNKLRDFIMQNTFETQVAGQLVYRLTSVFNHVNCHETLKLLLPLVSEKIMEALNNTQEIVQDSHLDNQLHYYLLLFQSLVITQGDGLLVHIDVIEKLLDKVMELKGRKSHTMSCQILNHLLNSLCTVQIISVEKNFDDSNYPYWNDWGESINVESAKTKWYVPSAAEVDVAKSIFFRYLEPAIAVIQNFIKTKSPSYREDLEGALRIINNILYGCDEVLPVWNEEPIVIEPYKLCSMNFEPTIGNNQKIIMPSGDNVRQYLIRIMTTLQEVMLENVEDDTVSLQSLCEIWNTLSSSRSMKSNRIPIMVRKSMSGMKLMENKITGDYGFTRHTFKEQIAVQHQTHKTHFIRDLTESSKIIILNLFKLSISQYSEIRKKAQTNLWQIISDYPSSHRILVPYIIEILRKDTNDHHEAYKGVLYLLNMEKGYTFLIKDDWHLFFEFLPALALAKPSEKTSIIVQRNLITHSIANLTTTNIMLEIPDGIVKIASELWECGVIPNQKRPTIDEISLGIQASESRGKANLKAYHETLQALLNAVLEADLHWRHREFAMYCMGALIHPNHPLPANIVRYFLKALLSDLITERKIAWAVVSSIFRQLKKQHPKITIDPPMKGKAKGIEKKYQYLKENWPTTAEQWDEPRYLHKSHIGYYVWPQKIEIFAPSSKQPKLRRSKSELNEQEREIDDFFSDGQRVTKLIELLSLEESKSEAAFNDSRYSMFKGLFRNHGDTYLKHFLPHLRNMVQDNQESVQRCAAEIISGLIRGMKHWSFEMTRDTWEQLLPIIRVALSHITEETIQDWSWCFSNANDNRDPNRMYWLIECLIEESELAQAETSYIESAKFMMLHETIESQVWRMRDIVQERLLPRIENRLLQMPFAKVRSQLAHVLISIFNDVDLTNSNFSSEYRHLSNFIDKMYPLCELLLNNSDPQSAEYIESARLMIAVSIVIRGSVCESYFGGIPSFYKLYPILSHLENSETSEELSYICTDTVSLLARVFTLPENVPSVLKAVEKVSLSTSWSARAGCVQFLQVFLVHNMSILVSNSQWIDTCREITLRLLKDDHVEVRECSAQLVNGMIHCTIITDRKELLESFKKLAKTKLRSKKHPLTDSERSYAIRMRHAGVLGMCAFILAHPYDVPKDIPIIFEYLSPHLNDPEPIPTTIKKTLNDFKRTHCNGWTDLQGLAQELTEEQFTILQDLIVPPSYYA